MREAQDSGQQRLVGFRKARGNILARLYICIWMRPQSLYRRCWCSRSSDPERGGNETLRALLGRDRRLDFSIFRVKSSVIGRRRLGCFTLSRSLEMPLGDRNCVYIDMRISGYRRHECGRKTWITQCDQRHELSKLCELLNIHVSVFDMDFTINRRWEHKTTVNSHIHTLDGHFFHCLPLNNTTRKT